VPLNGDDKLRSFFFITTINRQIVFNH
jgi:hypothetical protein